MAIISPATPLVLGSSSPRRREILSSLGLPLLVRAASIDEVQLRSESTGAYLERIVREKLAAAGTAASEETAAGLLVADTVVVVDDEVLGKPANVEDAVRLLEKLVGRTHVVLTRYAISRFPRVEQVVAERTVRSEVTMRASARDEVERYARSGEGLDKAGAYALQGLGAFLVREIAGSHTNVIGLPACEVVEDLIRCGLLGTFP